VKIPALTEDFRHLGQVVRGRVGANCPLISEDVLQPSFAHALDLALRKGHQRGDAHAPHQRVRHLGQRQWIRRASEQEHPLGAPLVDAHFERSHQFRRTLNLVDHHTNWQGANEADGIALGSREGERVIQADIIAQ